MKPQHISLLVFVGLGIIGWGKAAVAADEKLICQTYGGPFALDDTDFKAIAAAGSKITREKFGSLDADTRKMLCDSRKFWRLIQTGKADPCDFFESKHYHWLPEFFGPDEQDKLIDGELEATDEKSAKSCRR